MSIASLVLGILALICNPLTLSLASVLLDAPEITFFATLVSPLFALAAAIMGIVLGAVALRKNKGQPKKDGKAIAGVILGSVDLLLVAAMVVVFVVAFSHWGV